MIHRNKVSGEWSEENVLPFDELILSWNGARPSQGEAQFYVSVKTTDWSPWFLYAAWGSQGQSTFSATASDGRIRVYQDALEVISGEKGTGFRIKIEGEGAGAIERLHVYTNGDRREEIEKTISYTSSPYIPVQGLSQMVLNHERRKDLCSPVSTTTVIRHLSPFKALDPSLFAQLVWDGGFNIYGNWVLNVAEASAQLGAEWSCWVERLSGFDDIYLRLQKQIPVITSVRGPLPGSAAPYAQGHLVVVIGYDANEERVICIDPAFPSDAEAHVSYKRSDFIEAWNRRGRIAYLFSYF